jgi:hypothetical protein
MVADSADVVVMVDSRDHSYNLNSPHRDLVDCHSSEYHHSDIQDPSDLRLSDDRISGDHNSAVHVVEDINAANAPARKKPRSPDQLNHKMIEELPKRLWTCISDLLFSQVSLHIDDDINDNEMSCKSQ